MTTRPTVSGGGALQQKTPAFAGVTNVKKEDL
jgi:hypothetical protein